MEGVESAESRPETVNVMKMPDEPQTENLSTSPPLPESVAATFSPNLLAESLPEPEQVGTSALDLVTGLAQEDFLLLNEQSLETPEEEPSEDPHSHHAQPDEEVSSHNQVVLNQEQPLPLKSLALIAVSEESSKAKEEPPQPAFQDVETKVDLVNLEESASSATLEGLESMMDTLCLGKEGDNQQPALQPLPDPSQSTQVADLMDLELPPAASEAQQDPVESLVPLSQPQESNLIEEKETRQQSQVFADENHPPSVPAPFSEPQEESQNASAECLVTFQDTPASVDNLMEKEMAPKDNSEDLKDTVEEELVASKVCPPPQQAVAVSAASPSSPSRDDEPQQMLHHIKTIQFKDKKVGIVTQNENGPCPLVAIINVLLLRRQISLPASAEISTAGKLMEHIGNGNGESLDF